MKKTIFMLPALALMLFAACSSEDAVTKDNTAQLNETPENAIGFDAYLNRTVTRAGAPGILVTSGATTGQVNLRDQGFGVFGYYANGDLYSENATPNFMYNQLVKYDGDWKYEPIKYWPNEFGSSAISTGVDRVTFFAYAPYVGVDPTTGQLTPYYDDLTTEKSTTSGITSLTRNGKSGDPYVRYVGAFNPNDCVDLCYGVAAADYKSSIGASDGANNIKKGEPYLNVAKPEINSKIYFDFKHALAKLTVQIDADVDIANHADGGAPDEVDGLTRVWVRSITFDGIAQRGYLNLNSGMWYEIMDNNKISHASVTIHDRRRDGAEAIADDSYESPTGFNDALVQSAAYSATQGTNDNGVPKYTALSPAGGVTATYQNLFAGSGSLLVIPANEQLKVTIVYDVETADATLPTYLSDGVTKGSTVENKITKNITLGGTALKLESGNAYTLNLHLGLNSVKFDAKVSGWDETTGADADLPANVPVYEAASSPTTATATISSAAQKFEFKISGLNASEAVTATPSTTGAIVTALEQNAANASGVAYESITVAENTTVENREITPTTWTGSSSTKGVKLTLTQQAHPLELSVKSVSGKTLTLEKNTTSTWATCVSTPTSKEQIQVWRNGQVINVKTTDPSANEAKFDNSTGVLTFDSNLNPGDVVTVWIKAKDAAEESVTAKIGGPALSNAHVALEYGETYKREPKFYGDASHSYTWSISSGSVVSVDNNGVVTTVGVDDGATVQLATAAIEPANGWVYETSNRTYTVSVSKATGTISFTTPNPGTLSGTKATGEGTEIYDNPALLTNSKGNELLQEAAKGGTVTYEVESVTQGGAVGDKNDFNVTTTPGKLIIASGKTLTPSTQYTVTVKATVDDASAKATYSTKIVTYTVTFTTAGS